MLSVLLITQTGSRTRQHNYEFNGVWVNRIDEAWRHLPLAWRWKNPIVPWDRQYDSPYFINTLVHIFSFKSPDLIARDCFFSHFTIIHVKKLKNIFWAPLAYLCPTDSSAFTAKWQKKETPAMWSSVCGFDVSTIDASHCFSLSLASFHFSFSLHFARGYVTLCIVDVRWKMSEWKIESSAMGSGRKRIKEKEKWMGVREGSENEVERPTLCIE